MPAPLVAASSGAGHFLSGVFGGTKSARDKKRFAEIDDRYNRAIQGDRSALELLRTANYATAKATNYSRQRYQQALSVVGALSVSNNPPPAPLPMAGAAPPGSTPTTPEHPNPKGIPPVVIVGGLLVGWLLLKGR